jgi:hypothetical protein
VAVNHRVRGSSPRWGAIKKFSPVIFMTGLFLFLHSGFTHHTPDPECLSAFLYSGNINIFLTPFSEKKSVPQKNAEKY